MPCAPVRPPRAGAHALWLCAYLLLVAVTLGGCAGTPSSTPPPRTVTRAIVMGALHVLLHYEDPLHTYTLRHPQTWLVLDTHSDPRFAAVLGDGARFFEPITSADPDATNVGKLWVDVLPVQPGSTPRQVLMQPFVATDYPPALLARMTLDPIQLDGVPGYKLVTLASRTQVTILLIPWHGRYYRLTVFGATISAEAQLALDSWHFLTT